MSLGRKPKDYLFCDVLKQERFESWGTRLCHFQLKHILGCTQRYNIQRKETQEKKLSEIYFPGRQEMKWFSQTQAHSVVSEIRALKLGDLEEFW